MNEQTKVNTGLEKEEVFVLLSQIYQDPRLTQREISSHMNISLGKTNYLLNSLVDKGILKIKSFSKNNAKLRKIRYLLTQKGLSEKVRLTYYFLKKKEAEHNYLKEQWEKLTLRKYSGSILSEVEGLNAGINKENLKKNIELAAKTL